MEKHSGNKHHHNSPLANGVLPPPVPQVMTPNVPLIPHLPNTTLPPAAAIAASQHLITTGSRKDCIRLRGLPYEANTEHILDFLGEHARGIVERGVHMIVNKEVCVRILQCSKILVKSAIFLPPYERYSMIFFLKFFSNKAAQNWRWFISLIPAWPGGNHAIFVAL